MKRLRLSLLLAGVIVAFGLCDIAEAQEHADEVIFEAYPDEVLHRLQEAATIVEVALTDDSRFASALNYFVEQTYRWPVGTTLRVAFNGGSTEVREFVANACSEWTKFANLELEFKDPITGSFYEWTARDTEYRYHIRIGFDQPGYWSAIGTSSINSREFGPGDTSLNFSNFDMVIPKTGHKTIMHECGHAIGFNHEHLNPNGDCDARFKFQNDPGYLPTRKNGTYGHYVPDIKGRTPGIYLYFSGLTPPWDRPKVDLNIRNRPQSNAYDIASDVVDQNSIMIYELLPFMYIGGAQDPCYGIRLDTLSPGDQAGARLAYPFSFDSISTSNTKVVNALFSDVKEIESYDIESVDPSVATLYEAIRTQADTLLNLEYSQ